MLVNFIQLMMWVCSKIQICTTAFWTSAVFKITFQDMNCTTCNGEMRFRRKAIRGLGFKIVVLYDSCSPTDVPSCPKIGSSYEINSRLTFAIRCLGYGESGAKNLLFDGSVPFSRSKIAKCYKRKHSYSIKNNRGVAHEGCSWKRVITNEYWTGSRKLYGFMVSGDGTWQKSRFSSLFGVFSSNPLTVRNSKFCQRKSIPRSITKGQPEVWKLMP